MESGTNIVYCRDCEKEFILDDSEGERMSQDINGDWTIACPGDETCGALGAVEDGPGSQKSNEDERLDDPRRGQAEWINKQGRGER